MATIYASVTGGGDGSSAGSPLTLAQANATVQQGDTVILAAGTYTTQPLPTANTSAWTSQATYEGSTGTAGNHIISLSSDIRYLFKPWIKLKALRFNCNGFTIQSKRITLEDCVISCAGYKVSVYGVYGGVLQNVNNVTFDGCTITAAQFYLMQFEGGFPHGVHFMDDAEVRDCTLTLNPVDGGNVIAMQGARSLLWIGTTANITLGAGDGSPFKLFNVVESTFQNSIWNVTNNNPTASGFFTMRDGCADNYFNVCEFRFSGTGAISFIPSNSGNQQPGIANRRNRFEFCEFISTCPPLYPALFHNSDFIDGLTMKYCVVATNIGQAFGGNGFADTFQDLDPGQPGVQPWPGVPVTSIIDHCTFYTADATADVVELNDSASRWTSYAPKLTFTSNLMHGGVSANALEYGRTSYGVAASATLTSNWNLYYAAGSTAQISSNVDGTLRITTAGTDQTHYTVFGHDGNSVTGNPGLTNTTVGVDFDATPTGAPASGTGQNGSDIGALQIGVAWGTPAPELEEP